MKISKNYIFRIFPFVIFLLITENLCAKDSSGRQLPQTDSISVSPEGFNYSQSYKQLTKRQLRREKRKSRNFQYNILGGPSYSPDFGFLIGGSALFTFRTNKNNPELKRSVLPFNIALTSGGITLGSRPQIFFKGDRFRLFGIFNYKYNKDNYYGVGFDTNHNTDRGENTTLYTASSLQMNPYFLIRLGSSDFFLGPTLDFTLDKILKPAEGIINDQSFIASGGNSSGYSNISSGIGFIANYDSRDVPANAYKGLFLEARALVYNRYIGSNTNFYRAELDYRQYVSVGKRKVIAWTAQSKNVFGNVPITRMPMTGTAFDLRGYYMGQYRDKTSHILLVEYRHMFNSDSESTWGKILNRLGWVAWGGCGFMGNNPIKINGVLPNAGIGLRIEVQPRMNIRLDYGRNFTDRQNLFYFNMTEAF